jgi:hypothetical protein
MATGEQFISSNKSGHFFIFADTAHFAAEPACAFMRLSGKTSALSPPAG